jgi:SAM-dependent methyltransferase
MAALLRGITPVGRRQHALQLEGDIAFAKKRTAIDNEFDTKYDLDTGGKIELFDLSIDASTYGSDQGYAYQAIFPCLFHRGIESLKIEPGEFVFIDLGAGKGRALFLAQDYLFKRVVGVEFARELVAVCQRNILRRSVNGMKRSPIDILLMDALAYEFPDEPIVLFLFNPFGAEIVSQICKRLYASLKKTPRPLKILYFNPIHDDQIVEKTSEIRRLEVNEAFNSYEWIL